MIAIVAFVGASLITFFLVAAMFAPLRLWDRVLLSRAMDYVLHGLLGLVAAGLLAAAWGLVWVVSR